MGELRDERGRSHEQQLVYKDKKISIIEITEFNEKELNLTSLTSHFTLGDIIHSTFPFYGILGFFPALLISVDVFIKKILKFFIKKKPKHCIEKSFYSMQF